MRKTHRMWLLFLIVFVLGGGSQSVAQQDTALSSERVMLRGTAALTELNALVVGEGIDGTTPVDFILPQQGRIAWRKIRDEKDDLGMRHVFYQQRFFPIGRIASLVESKYLADGIEITGSEIGVHFRDAEPRLISGYQVRNIALANEPTIGREPDAFEAVHAEAQRWPGFAVPDRASWSTEVTAARHAGTRLKLMPSAASAAYRFVWSVPTADRDGATHGALLDAGTGALVSLGRVEIDATAPSGSPVGATQVSATLLPQNTSMSRGGGWASVGSNLDGFTHEGAKLVGDYSVPPIWIYMGTNRPDWACNVTSAQYAMLPLQTSGGVPTFENWTSPITVPGRSGGDAMWFTSQAMQVLRSLGRNGWDNGGGTAKVVVDWLGGDSDGARFTLFPSNFAPTYSVDIFPKLSLPYTASAALDVVAHEWGHGVVATSANFPYPNWWSVGGQLHEGFADVIGYTAEWFKQPAGAGYENADWKFGEDMGMARRWVDVDDGPGNFTFHKDDDPATVETHARGNMLGVVFRLMAVGGTNPVCARLQTLPGCSTVVSAVGLNKAANILFKTLTVFSGSYTQWADLKDNAIDAAFYLYSRCSDCTHPYSATAEQGAVDDAFTAIGYTTPGSYWTCPCRVQP